MSGRTSGSPASVMQCWRLNQLASAQALQLPKGEFALLADASALHLQEQRGSVLAGFLFGMPSSHPQPHFSQQWFLTRFEDLLYLERIVVAPSLQRTGIGSALLARAVDWSLAAGLQGLCCQVHDRPRNSAAHAFVLASGFTALESVMLPSREIVTMYQRSIAIATP